MLLGEHEEKNVGSALRQQREQAGETLEHIDAVQILESGSYPGIRLQEHQMASTYATVNTGGLGSEENGRIDFEATSLCP